MPFPNKLDLPLSAKLQHKLSYHELTNMEKLAVAYFAWKTGLCHRFEWLVTVGNSLVSKSLFF